MSEDKPGKGTIRVFVYGSLKMDHGNHPLLARGENTRFLGRDSVTGPYGMINMGGFPGAYFNTEGTRNTIYGELYSVDAETFASLDMLEGHPRFYFRQKVRTENDINAWMYFLSENWVARNGVKMFTPEREVTPAMWLPSTEEKEFWADKKERDELKEAS